MFRYDLQNNAMSCDTTSFSTTPALAWKYSTGSGSTSSSKWHVTAGITEKGGTVYAASDHEDLANNAYDASIFSLSASNGS